MEPLDKIERLLSLVETKKTAQGFLSAFEEMISIVEQIKSENEKERTVLRQSVLMQITEAVDKASQTLTELSAEEWERVKTQIRDVRDGIDGKDGVDGTPGAPGKDGENGSPDTPDQIIEKVNKSTLTIAKERIEGLVDLVRMTVSNAVPVTTSFFNGLRGKNLTIDGATAKIVGDTVHISGISGGSGTPGGSDTQVQFNDGNSFGGDAGLTYDKTNDVLGVGGGVEFKDTGQSGDLYHSITVDAQAGNTGADLEIFGGGADTSAGTGGNLNVYGGYAFNGGNTFVTGGNSNGGRNGDLGLTPGVGGASAGFVKVASGYTTFSGFFAKFNTNSISGADKTFTFPDASGTLALIGLSGTKVYYVADSSGGAVTRKLTFINGILTSET